MQARSEANDEDISGGSDDERLQMYSSEEEGDFFENEEDE